MQKSKNTTKNAGWITRLLAVGCCFYLCGALVFTQLDIVAKRQRIVALDAEIDQQQEAITELSRLLGTEESMAYIERLARDRLGYAAPNERIFIDISGK